MIKYSYFSLLLELKLVNGIIYPIQLPATKSIQQLLDILVIIISIFSLLQVSEHQPVPPF